MNHRVADTAQVPPYGFDLAPPLASSLAESMRAFGYDVATAIADLVDNSISARAKQVWVDFHWNGSDSTISVTDDGEGMTSELLVAAMKLGSQNPRDTRSPHDLGRFGLGLKTASFSQCRRLTVRSNTRGGTAATRCWDLDHLAAVNDWQLLHTADELAERYFERLEKLAHGTTVLWQKLDRLTGGTSRNSEKHQQRFLEHAEGVRNHLSTVFHRLMTGREQIDIVLNGRSVTPWDPFLQSEPATQILPATVLTLHGESVRVQPFVLPHHTKISKATHEAAAGVRGWNAHQGFYIYRNRRLLVAGDWFGFGWAKEEHYKLARIQVDTPNSLDHDWSIDVTKSRAIPPTELRDDLRKIAERTRADAKRVYSYRGAKLTPRSDQARILLWQPIARHDKTYYRLNPEHPLLARALAASADKRALRALLRLIEETIPFPHITISGAERPGTLPGPFDHAAEKQIRDVMEQVFRSLVDSGYGAKEAIDRLKTIWPFELFPAVLASLAESLTDAADA